MRSRDCQGGGIYVRGIKMDPGSHKEMCLTQVSSSMLFYELLLTHGWTLISFSSWQTHHLHFLFWKEPTHFTDQLSLFACSTEPIPINLTRIFNLHNEGQIKIDTCNPSLYKLLSLFSSEHSADCYLNLCFSCNHWHSNKYFLFIF